MNDNSDVGLILGSSVFILLSFILIIYLLSNHGELGKQTAQGSETKKTKNFKKYTSIKEIPVLKESIGKSIVVVYFNHGKCAGCVQLSPRFKALSMNEDYKRGNPQIQFFNINPQIDNVDLVSIGILFVPTILIFDNDGDLIKNFIGLINGSAELVIKEVRGVLDSLY